MAVSANSKVLSSPHELPRASNTTKALAAHVADFNWQKRRSCLLPNVLVSADAASTWFWHCYLGSVHHNVWYSQVSVSRAVYQYTMWIPKQCESHLYRRVVHLCQPVMATPFGKTHCYPHSMRCAKMFDIVSTQLFYDYRNNHFTFGI